MVKLDPNEDYYAALGCTPQSDTNEVKRKFRSLALRYHPDRNPGKEEEFNSKFQAIQAAHEILTDETQRAKYDVERARRAAKPTGYASPTRSNVPPRSPASNFPPPPRAPPPPAGFKSAFPRKANNYKQYPRADAASSFPPNVGDDNQAKANAFKAWEQMRHGQGPPPTRAAPPKVPPRNPSYRPAPTATTEETSPKEPPRRPSWNPQDPVGAMPRRANTTRVPKSNGFANPDFTTEKPAHARTSAYANVARGEKPGVSRPSTLYDPPMSGRDRPDPLRPFRDSTSTSNPFSQTERLSTPYATSGGEKTYFSSQAFSRTASGRDPAEMPNVETPNLNGTHARNTSHGSDRGHRSASPKFRSPPQPVSVSSSSSSGSSSEEEEDLYTTKQPRPRKVPTTRFKTRNPAGEARVPTFGTSVRMDDEAAAQPAQRVRTHPVYVNGTPNPPSGFVQPSHPPKVAPMEGFAQHRLKRESGQNLERQKWQHVGNGYGEADQPSQKPMRRPRSWDAKFGTTSSHNASGDARPETRPSTSTHPERPKIFTFPASNPNQRTHPPPFRSQSSETINTTFSPGGFPGRFTSNPPTPRQSREPSRVRTSPMKAQTSGEGQPPKSASTMPNKDSQPRTNAPQPLNHERYRNEDWAKHFQPDTHTYPPPPSRSPTRAQNRKRPNPPARPFGPATKRPTAAAHTSGATVFPEPVGPSQDGAAQDTAAQSTDSSVKTAGGDDSAMDIDTPPSRKPSDSKVPTPPPNHMHDRRPSFQAEQVGVPPRPRGPPVPARPKSHIDTTNVPASASAPSTPQPPQSKLRPPPAELDHPLNLSSLKSTAPFTPSNGTSINNLNDLSASLPFTSRPSAAPPTPNQQEDSSSADPATHATTSSQLPAPLNLPKPPRGPPVPEGKLTTLSFNRYVSSMHTYMTEWNAYNATMLAHFNARQARCVESLEAPVLTQDGAGGAAGGNNGGGVLGGITWINASGDAGYKAYARGLEEDVRVREHWDVSWEKHREVMKRLGEVRERVAKGGNLVV